MFTSGAALCYTVLCKLKWGGICHEMPVLRLYGEQGYRF